MNCKPGERAIIVKESLLFYQDIYDYYFRFPVGTIVKVLKENTTNVSGNDSNNKIKYHEWVIDKQLIVGLVGTYGGKECTVRDKAELDYWCPDDVLKPLRGFEDDGTVTEINEEEITA